MIRLPGAQSRSPEPKAGYSCTTSTRNPNGASSRDFGWTKNTVVPRDPLRGALSMILNPFACQVVERALDVGHAERDVREARRGRRCGR